MSEDTRLETNGSGQRYGRDDQRLVEAMPAFGFATWMPPHPTLYVRRALYQRHGGFDIRYRIAADYDCILRLLSRLGALAWKNLSKLGQFVQRPDRARRR